MNKIKKDINKMLMALVVAGAPTFTFLLFGPFEMIAANQNSIDFKVMQILPVLFMSFVVATLIITVVLYVTRGKTHDFLVLLIFTITICGYIQGNLGNQKIGQLTGFFIDWNKMVVYIALNTVIWIVIGVLIFIVYKRVDGKKKDLE